MISRRPQKQKTHSPRRVGQETLLLLVSYAAGSPDCCLDVAVHVLVVVKHMSMATLLWRTCMMGHYSPEKLQSQGCKWLCSSPFGNCWLFWRADQKANNR